MAAPEIDVAAFSNGYLKELQDCLAKLPQERLAAVVALLWDAYSRGARVFIAGNGGSAATANHMACDLAKTVAGRDGLLRGFNVMSLSDNVALMTAWSNDTSYERVFAEPLRSFSRSGDLLIVVSASGNSPNILAAVECARSIGVKTIGLLGFGGGKAASLVDEAIVVASHDYGVVEDVHLALNHVVTGFFQQKLCAR